MNGKNNDNNVKMSPEGISIAYQLALEEELSKMHGMKPLVQVLKDYNIRGLKMVSFIATYTNYLSGEQDNADKN